MHFKIDSNLIAVASAANRSGRQNVEDFSRELADAFIKAGQIQDNKFDYGIRLDEATTDCFVSEVWATLCVVLGVTRITSDVWDAACALVVVGEGNCPGCGCDMEMDALENMVTMKGDQYLTPDSVEPAWIRYRCPNCGKVRIWFNPRHSREHDERYYLTHNN